MVRNLSKSVSLLSILMFVFSVFPQFASAIDTSSLSPATMADDAGIGVQAWQNVDNAKVSDDAYVTATSICFVAGTKIKTANFHTFTCSFNPFFQH